MSQVSTGLSLQLFGLFRLERDSRVINLRTRKVESLFAYLALFPNSHPREKLATLLWGDSTDEQARHSLRTALADIRREVGDELVLADRESVQLNPAQTFTMDVREFEQGGDADIAGLKSQIEKYYDGLLPDFYDDWILLERERLRALFEQKMEMLLEQLVACESWDQVIETSERWIAQGQTPEAAYQALMITYAAQGDKIKVASTFQRASDALRNELGVAPSEQMQALFDELWKRQMRTPVFKNPVWHVPSTTPIQPIDDNAPPAPGEPPYKGLQYFDVNDADAFFGREQLIAKLIGHLRVYRFLAVIVGASGSGKSSVVRAGMVPALARSEQLADSSFPPDGSREWRAHIITPGSHPLESIALAVTRDTAPVKATAELMDAMTTDTRTLDLFFKRQSDLPPTLLVIDQFEEIFTLCKDEAERAAAVNNLINAISSDNARLILVITLRADFYAHCAQYANLREWVAKNQEYIGPMNAEELRRAIEEPARRGNWEFEPGLVDLIMRDVGTEPGALPLLSHALLETWQRRRGTWLTRKGYFESGGVRGAIARTAETVYRDLSPAQQMTMRRILLRLTELGEGTEDTRRRASFRELIAHPEEAQQVQTMLKTLADARLIILSEYNAEVAHEALIQEWQRLRDWLSEDRQGLRVHRGVTEAATEWEELGREDGALYRGTRLEQALEWVRENPTELNQLEDDFLTASKELKEREETEREGQRQRELIAAQKLLETQTQAARQLRRRAVILAGAFALSIVLAFVALLFGDQARQSTTAAQTERRITFARELAANANSNLDIDPERSILLAQQAIAVSTNDGQPVLREAEEALHRAITTSRLQMTLRGHTNSVSSVAYSPDGTRIATLASNDSAKIWDSTTGKELLSLPTQYPSGVGIAKFLAFSPDGKFLATVFGAKQIKIWDASTGQPLQTFAGHASGPIPLSFSPDGKRLASGGSDGTIKVWDVATAQELIHIAGHKDQVLSVAFSPDGKRLATGSLDRSAKVWDVATGQLLLTLTGHSDRVYALAFTPDGTRLITASGDTTTRIWDLASGRTLLTLFGHVSVIVGLAIDSTGTRLATASEDGTAKVWDVATGQNLFTLSGHSGGVVDVAFSSDGMHVVTGSRDKTARVWDISGTGGREWINLIGHNDLAVDIAYSPDGKRLATASYDKTIKIWDAETGKEQQTISGISPVQSVAFSPDGSRLVTKGGDGIARVWDMSTGKELLKITTEQIPTAAEIARVGLAISPDGKRLATGSSGNKAKIWNAETGEELLTLTGHTGSVWLLAFSPDGTRLATTSDDRTAKIWDVTTGKEIVTFIGHSMTTYGVTFSPNGKYVATTSNDGTVRVWDATTGKEIQVLNGHTGAVFGVAFSNDGKRLASTSVDKTIKIWDVSQITEQVKEPLTLFGHNAAVYRVAWSPDGTRLATASRDRTARVWALKLEDLIAIAKSRVTRTLTTDECQKFLHVAQCPP